MELLSVQFVPQVGTITMPIQAHHVPPVNLVDSQRPLNRVVEQPHALDAILDIGRVMEPHNVGRGGLLLSS